MDPSRIFNGGSMSILILIFTQLVDVGDANTAAQCAQFGVNDKLYWEYGNEGANTKQGYVTIAGKEYDAKWIASIGSRYYFGIPDVYKSILPIKADGTCPWEFYNKKHRIEPCVDNKLVRMDMYLVKQHGHVLRGWVHVEIELLDKDDVIELLYIQMRDEAFNAIGEFATPETHDGAKCKPTKSYLATPKHYEFFPCSATGLREAKTSQAIMMAQKEYYFDQELVKNGWVYDGSIERGVHFLWKFDEYWCSRHWRFQPYAYIMTRKNRLKYEKFAVVAKEQQSQLPELPSVEDYPRMLRKVPNHWLYHKWIGAADIILGIGELDCSELAIDDNTGKVTPAAVNSWFVDKHPENSSVKLLEDNWHPKNRYLITKTTEVTGSISYGSNLCQADPLDKKQTKDTVPVFSGRCQGHFEKAVSRETFQGCNTNASSQEFEAASNIDFTNLTAYRNKTTKDRLLLCTNITCKSPDSEGDLKDIKQYEAGNMTKNASEYIIAGFNDRRTKSKIAKFWHGRKYHGVLCSIVAFFITPVYIFIARYFKETYLRSRCFDIPVWYWWHAGGVIISATLFASSYAAMSPNFPIWGRSEHSSARIHMISGYASIVIFGIIVVFGGCRCAVEYDRGKCMRLCSLTTHAVLGTLHHLLNLFTIITSAWIPQSPALNDCDKKKGMPEGIGLIVFVAAGFLVVEFLFHLLLTVLLCMTDKKEEVNRGWWCPILPFLPISVISDYSGATARKIMLALYVDITLAFALVASGLILKKELPENCRIGPMTCKHVFGCTKLAIQYEKWFLNNGGNITGLE